MAEELGTVEDVEDVDIVSAWQDDYEFSDDEKKILSRFKTPEDAHKSYVELHKLSSRSISLPKDDAPDADKQKKMGEIYGKLGRPESPDGYQINRPETLPEGMAWNDDIEKELKERAHKMGWNQAQIQDASDFYHELRQREVDILKLASNKVIEMTTRELKGIWGVDFDANLEGARRAFDVYGSDDFVSLMDKTGLKNHPVVIKTFFEIYRDKLAEGSLVTGAARTGTTGGGLDYSKPGDMLV